ncbi:MAG: pheT, partial [Frankiales bacterium]|nr:pheT [Frankiales bacterium]
VVTDESGPIALAGVMGGGSTEISDSTTDIVLEAAHWDPASIARAVRRHKLPSEAAKRFERGVDPAIAAVALQRAVDLLVEHGGARPAPGFTVVGSGPAPVQIPLEVSRAARLSGLAIDEATVRARLEQVGCAVLVRDEPSTHVAEHSAAPISPAELGGEILVTPPTWRPDLTDPVDLVEEVVRLEGYDRIPSTLPPSPAGIGLTGSQRLRRSVSRELAAAGYSEVLSYPFVAPSVHDVFGLAADDPRRQAVRLANPLSDAEPEMRTSLLPGLLATLGRNLGRGNRDLAVFEMGLVYRAAPSAEPPPQLGVTRRPTPAELISVERAIPEQPRHVAVALTGDFELPGWLGPGRAGDWTDALAAARLIARAAGAAVTVRKADIPPWHPGRCAEVLLDGAVVGAAGELHPRVLAELGLPERTCAMELNLDRFPPPRPASAPELSSFPPVLLDLALVVAEDVPAAEVLSAVEAGAGQLLESVRLFDVYADESKLGRGLKSLAFALRFRAPDRTLTIEEATAARDQAVAEAHRRVGATIRG